MRTLWKSMTACLAAALLVTSAARAEELAVKLTVAEPAGIERKSEPASGGVPFRRGQVKSADELALFTASGQPVPAQFTRISPYEDGSVQWALVDVLVDLPASGKGEFVIKSGKAAAPPKALDIKDSDAAAAVDTGVAKFTVNKADFNLLDSVEVGGKKVAGPGAVEITSNDGKAFRAGKPTKIAWEYKGPVRATLRVDGEYQGEGGAKFISYTTRLTFWAGLAVVRVDHSVRNSNPKEGDDVKIKSAVVSVGFKGAEAGKGPGWAAATEGGTPLLVSHRHTGGCFPGRSAEFEKVAVADGQARAWVIPEGSAGKGTYGYGEGFFALADCAHKDSQVWFDFRTDAAGAEKRHKAYRSWLHALADPRHISETACLGFGRFGTLEDEVATYKKWGWSGIDDARKRAPTQKAPSPNAFLDMLEVHFESEADSAELDLLMYVRTGQRGFLDEGEAYTRYFKTHYMFRSDGFEYDGWRHGHVSAALSAKSKRPTKGLRFDWREPSVYGWAQSRWCYCHFWGAGLFDYYCLTGDVDALEAGIDCAEVALALNSGSKPGSPLGLSRAWGREFMCVLRAYQVTKDPRWKQMAEQFADQVKKAPNKDKSGLYNAGVNTMMVKEYADSFFGNGKSPAPEACRKYIQEHGITHKIEGNRLKLTDKDGKTWEVWESPQSFEFAASIAAIARYAEIMQDKEMSKVVVELAEGALKHYWSEKCQHHTSYYHHPHIGMPIADTVYDEADWSDVHKNCATGEGGKHSGYHSRYMAEIFAVAYTDSGDPKWLEMAKKAWNRGTKRGYWTTKQSCPDNEVAEFAGHRAPKGDGVDIRCSYRLFFEVPRAK
ncbi:MAG TPA: hypothetical protein PK280_11735 [Planctomycetota bacterium]|nr:hypothetical protein [Planctomycetota bacterium]